MSTVRPRVGFLGVGWIGRHRMEGMLDLVEAAAISDPSPEMVAEAAKLAPGAAVVANLDAMLALGLDGVVIATPSALHADQSIRALRAGTAVFCQKPLGRSAAEVQAVIDAAKAADRLLGVDLSYRHTAAMAAIRPLVEGDALGHVHAVDLVFHNAWGPDKPWFYDRALSGGGCVMDLGVHLVDLALWTLGFPKVVSVTSHLSAQGRPLGPSPVAVEDFAVATLVLETGTVVRLACSWRLHAGQEAVIEANFYGTAGAASLRNVNGSFYDFVAERHQGTGREGLVAPPDNWGARGGQVWARQLARSPGYDPEAAMLVRSAEVLDRIYAGA